MEPQPPTTVPGWDPAEVQEATYINPQNLWQSNPLIQSQQNAFTQTFQNLMGRTPTADEINTFFQQSYVGQQHPDLLNPYTTAQGYVTNAFGPQIAQYNQQQQQQQLQNSLGNVQGIVNQTMQNTAGQLADPNSQIYQTLAGAMNNEGITPSSGAFQAGAGSTIANAGLNAANAGLSSVGFPQISNIAGTSNNPYQQAIGAPATQFGQIQGLNNFDMEAQLAQMLQQQGQPSGLMNDIGMASGAAQGAGSLAQGIGLGFGKSGTWVCTAMVRYGAMTASEVRTLHDHLFKAFWKKPWKFIGYWLFGKMLVYVAESVNTNWYLWKSEFYDLVMEEPDPAKAVDLYEIAFWHLFRNVWMRDRKARA